MILVKDHNQINIADHQRKQLPTFLLRNTYVVTVRVPLTVDIDCLAICSVQQDVVASGLRFRFMACQYTPTQTVPQLPCHVTK